MKKVLTLLGALAMVFTTSASTAAPISLEVVVGKPIWRQDLHYEVMYDQKPFRPATLYYYDNGLYKIVSPGEDHYGVYVIEGQFTDPVYHVSYISLPSADWGGKTALHALTFRLQGGKGTFEQRAVTDTGEHVSGQHGSVSQQPHGIADPAQIRWE
ncbi:hypothetical protein [Pseudomonas typographi]|uniref:Uncharacterized protein n=1 Tax=Pseudomonas typographi TaxID=2715964 RepID=A0ABR7Z405_9PSED|nr:hypothetical protein [Pseudomonas typographi]MBD1588243.1 hypothetical protein [Pseudomonas typographi]MBD1600214.1 hypothetical protein [Pseudomonas typographi]